MGIESYNFLLIPKDNEVSFNEDLLEINGTSKLRFSEVTNIISSLHHVNPYIPKDISKSSHPACYFFYSDQICIIEIEINAGIIEDDGVEEISVRFAATNPVETFQKAIEICKIVSNQLNLLTIDMKLKEVIDLSDELQLAKSRNSYEAKSARFYEMYNLQKNTWIKPTHCGKALFEELRR